MSVPRKTANSRLLGAGYKYVSGWVPENTAIRMQAEIDRHKKAVTEIELNRRPIGRPRKEI